MSKKSKKNNTNKKETKDTTVGAAVLAQMGMMDKDDDGFVVLNPTDDGERELDNIRTRRSKKKSTAPEPKPKARAYEDFDAQKAEAMLDSVIEKVKAGKFKKALALRDKELVENLIGAFTIMSSDLPNFPKVAEAITKLIRIGKTFYEYADGLEFMDNITYDGIMARYQALGMTEPQEYVPLDNSSGKSKVGVKYPTLHNTMDKAYAIRKGDPIPEGVKESDRIEDFVKRIYNSLGLKPSATIELELSPKIDGVSINGTVQTIKGNEAVLLSPQTRGDIAESMKVIGADGLSIGESVTEGSFGIQYEAFVTNDDLVKASKYLKLDTPYKSNRHAASGIINRLCSGEDDNLLMYISLYPIESSGLDGSYVERMDLLQAYGIVPDDMIKRKIIKGDMTKLVDKIEKHFNKLQKARENLSYAIDGMVITVVDDKYQNDLGRKGRTNLYQIALKFDPASTIAEVAGIHLDNGKRGYRTIQVDLKHPVFLDGVKYDHVPVLSADLFTKMGLRVGSEVNVHRVGDVIPAITKISNGIGSPIRLPVECPDCGKPLEIKNKKLHCNNVGCSGNLVGRILGFFEAIGMDGYGEEFVNMLIKKFGAKAARKRREKDFDNAHKVVFLCSLSDLFDLTPKQFKRVGVTTKLAMNFHDTLVDAVARTPDYIILGSIGVPDLGPARAKQVLKKFGSWKKFMDGFKGCGSMTLAAAVGGSVGRSIASCIYHDPDMHSMIQSDLHTINEYMETFTSNFNELITVGHTGGKLSMRVQDVCAKECFDITDSKKFDILITKSMHSDSDKMRIARKKSIPVYTEEGFLSKYDPSGNDDEEDD